ncbi:3'-5' exonuclease [Actinoplanes sp. M2I2]|uniref:3'-5' exonuclease n=1 Tax=Actinoplanes sp. M2I2 TaxID=1734444 RepID=UPI0020226245|nr:3'-5' exonuclease [Actinoplanes sp. M2I2]
MIIILDLEFTAWEGSQEHGWSRPGEFREVVQIGALRVDTDTLGATGEFNELVRPERNPSLSGYFQDLTGITQAAVDERGLPFPDALDAFLDFCDDHYVLSYGNDMVILGENLVLQVPQGRTPKRGLPPFVNIRTYFNRVLPATIGLSSGRLAFELGLAARLDREHDALADCYSILETLRHLRESGHSLIEL